MVNKMNVRRSSRNKLVMEKVKCLSNAARWAIHEKRIEGMTDGIRDKLQRPCMYVV